MNLLDGSSQVSRLYLNLNYPLEIRSEDLNSTEIKIFEGPLR